MYTVIIIKYKFYIFESVIEFVNGRKQLCLMRFIAFDEVKYIKT